MAQLVAHLLCKQGVTGSSPVSSTITKRADREESLRSGRFLFHWGIANCSHCCSHSLSVRPTADVPFTVSATLEHANGVGALGSHPICFGVHVCFIAAPDIRLSLVTARECYTADADHGA